MFISMPLLLKDELVGRIRSEIETRVLAFFTPGDGDYVNFDYKLEIVEHEPFFQFYLRDNYFRHYFPSIIALGDSIGIDSCTNPTGLIEIPFDPNNKDECFDKVIAAFVDTFPKDNCYKFHAIDEHGFERNYTFRTKN